MTKKTNSSDQLESDTYNSKSLEDSENKLETLRQLLIQEKKAA